MLLVHDNIVTDYGHEMANLYVCFDSKLELFHLGNNNFELRAMAKYRLSHDHTKPVLKNEVVSLALVEADLVANLFELLYSELENKYQNTERV